MKSNYFVYFKSGLKYLYVEWKRREMGGVPSIIEIQTAFTPQLDTVKKRAQKICHLVLQPELRQQHFDL